MMSMVILLALVLLYSIGNSQSNLDSLKVLKSVEKTGKLLDVEQFTINSKDSMIVSRVGTAFVIGIKSKYICTAGHCAIKDTLWYAPFSHNLPLRCDSMYKACLKYKLINKDIAVYEIIETEGLPGFSLQSAENVLLGTTVYYIGWENMLQIVFHSGTIESIGKMNFNGYNVAFVEIQGNGVPGYSGGPVLNRNYDLIGLINLGYKCRQLESDSTFNYYLRAFCIDTLISLDL